MVQSLKRFSIHYSLILILLSQSMVSSLAAQSPSNVKSKAYTQENTIHMQELVEYAQKHIQTEVSIEQGILKAQFIGRVDQHDKKPLQFGAAIYGLNELSKKIQTLIAQEGFEVDEAYSNIYIKFIRINDAECKYPGACYLEIRGGETLRWSQARSFESGSLFNAVLPSAYAQSGHHQLNQEENNSFMAGLSDGAFDFDVKDDALNAAISASIGVIIGVFNGLGPVAWTLLTSYAVYTVGTELVHFGKKLYQGQYYEAGKVLGALCKDVLISVLSGVAGQIAGKSLIRMLTKAAKNNDKFAIIARELLKIIELLKSINQKIFRSQEAKDASDQGPKDHDLNPSPTQSEAIKPSSAKPTDTGVAQKTQASVKQELSNYEVTSKGDIVKNTKTSTKDGNHSIVPVPFNNSQEQNLSLAQSNQISQFDINFDLKDIGISEKTMMSSPQHATLLYAKDFGQNYIIHLPKGGAIEEWRAYERFRQQENKLGVNNVVIPRLELWQKTYTGASPGTDYTDQDAPRTYLFAIQILPGAKPNEMGMSEEVFSRNMSQKTKDFIHAMDHYNNRSKERYWGQDIRIEGDKLYLINNSDQNVYVRSRPQKHNLMTVAAAKQWIEHEAQWTISPFETTIQPGAQDVYGLTDVEQLETIGHRDDAETDEKNSDDDEENMVLIQEYLDDNEIKVWDSWACRQAILLGNIPSQCMILANRLLELCRISVKEKPSQQMCETLQRLLDARGEILVDTSLTGNKYKEEVVDNLEKSGLIQYTRNLLLVESKSGTIANFFFEFIKHVYGEKRAGKVYQFFKRVEQRAYHEILYVTYNDLKEHTNKSYYKNSRFLKNFFPRLEAVFDPKRYKSRPENKIFKVDPAGLKKLIEDYKKIKTVFPSLSSEKIDLIFRIYAQALNHNMNNHMPYQDLEVSLEQDSIKDIQLKIYQEIYNYKPKLSQKKANQNLALDYMLQIIVKDEMEKYDDSLEDQIENLSEHHIFQSLSSFNEDLFFDFVFDAFEPRVTLSATQPQVDIVSQSTVFEKFAQAIKSSEEQKAISILLYHWGKKNKKEKAYQRLILFIEKRLTSIIQSNFDAVNKKLTAANNQNNRLMLTDKNYLPMLDHARYYYVYQTVFSGLDQEQEFFARKFVAENKELKPGFLKAMKDEDAHKAQGILIRCLDLVGSENMSIAQEIKSSLKKVKKIETGAETENTDEIIADQENELPEYAFVFMDGFEKKFAKLPNSVKKLYYENFVNFIKENGIEKYIATYGYKEYVNKEKLHYSPLEKKAWRIHWKHKDGIVHIESIEKHH
ncbi:hypothetical protein MRY82_02590 [bacterium]|nr:hypothetical protein [bacterium]